MENPVVEEVATIIDENNDIDEPIPKQTNLSRIW